MPTNTGFIHSISELALWVHDLDKAVTFYRDCLGFSVQSVDAGQNAFLKSGNFLLVLFNRADPGTVLAEEYLTRTGGASQGEVYHVAFRVEPDLLNHFGEALRGHGVDVKGPVSFATGRRSYFFEDPDRHYIELTDR